ncbi:hypothetical protein PENTCL1PPCAC_21318, partial [Pristionchus entomophagus]
LTLLALLCYQAWAMCPSGFELVRNGECHRELYGAQNTYAPTGAAQAISFCADYGAIPVNIKNQEDHDYWVSVAKAEKTTIGSDYGNIILGIYCDNTNHWMWADGREVYYEWKPEDYDEDLHERCGEQGAYCMWTINPVTNNWQKWCNTYQWTANYCIIEPTEKPAEPDRDCTNFDHEDDDDLCYQVGKYPANYTEANTICHSFGANVASIHNERENTFVRRLAASHGLINGMMLGAAYNSKKNSFKWADGTTWDYDNFAPGFPLVGFGECVAMETNNIGGQWINIDCSTELPFACIRQPDDEDPVCDGALRKENDIIYNPGFPSDASIPCDFILKVDPGKLVEVEILMLEANSCCDRLVLTEGTLGGAEIATLTGEMYNGWTFRTTSQNVMRVSWQPHGGVNVKGMMVNF